MQSIGFYMAQRVSAMVMAPLVLGHIAVMIYAIQGGLSTAEILDRTRGSLAWFAFYGSFVVAVSVHASIGLRVVVGETLKLRGVMLDLLTWGAMFVLLFMGARAVSAVTML